MKESQLPTFLGVKLVVCLVMFMLFFPVGVTSTFASDLVQRIQQALTEKGYEPGPVDGLWGPKTKNALMKFQESEGLSPTGKLDNTTKKHLLGAKGASMSKAMSTQAASGTGSSGSRFPDAPDDEIVWGPHKPR